MFALLSAARKALTGTTTTAAPAAGARHDSARHSSARRRMLLALPAAGLVAACQPMTTGGGGPSVDASKPVPVALLVPQGSGNSGDAVLSTSLINSARLAAAELNGVQIDLRIYDTKGDPQETANVTQAAIAEGAKIILGPVYAANANAAGRVAAQHRINVLAFSNNPSIAGGNVFILGPTFQNTANRMTSYAVSQNKNRIVVVRSDNAEGEAGNAAIQQAANSYGATITASVPYQFSQQGVVDSLPQITSAAGNGNADALFLTANTAGALPLYSQMLGDNGLGGDAIQYIGLTRWDVPSQTLDLPGLQGGWFALPDPNMTAQFNARYQAAYGSAPHPIGGLAFDGVAAVGALVREGDALSTGALTQPAGFQGVGGVFRFLPDGTNERGMAVASINNHQVVVIDPAPTSFAGF